MELLYGAEAADYVSVSILSGGIGGSFYKASVLWTCRDSGSDWIRRNGPFDGSILLLVRSVRWKAFPWIVVTTGALFLATSGHTSLGPWLYKVPVINQFRASGRFVLFADIAAAVLGGLSITALRRNTLTRPFKLAFVFAVPVVLVGYGVYVWGTSFRSDAAAHFGMTMPQFSTLELPAIVVPIIAAFVVAAGLAALSWAPQSRPVLVLTLAAVVLELSMFGSFFSWDTASPGQPSFSCRQLLRLIRSNFADQDSVGFPFRVLKHHSRLHPLSFRRCGRFPR